MPVHAGAQASRSRNCTGLGIQCARRIDSWVYLPNCLCPAYSCFKQRRLTAQAVDCSPTPERVDTAATGSGRGLDDPISVVTAAALGRSTL